MAGQVIEVPHGFVPRDYQRPAWDAMTKGPHKRVLMVWNRRAGKDRTTFNAMVIRAIKRKQNAVYYFPDAMWARRAIWDAIDVRTGFRFIDHIPKELIASKSEQQMKIRLVNGSTIQILGTAELSVVGGNYHTVAFSEYSLQDPMAWTLTSPILAENGGVAWFNGTPRGQNHFWAMYKMAQTNPDWFVSRLSVDETQVVSPTDIDAERRSGMSEAMIRQEYYCDFTASNEGSIYGRFIERAEQENRVGNWPVDGTAPVHTAWDLGAPRNTVVTYFQVLPFGIIRFVDCDSGHDFTLAERVAYIKAKGYNLGNAYLPHDAAQTARNGHTFQSEAQAAGLANIFVVPPCQSVWPGINHAGSMFGQFEFRLPACERLIEALRGYHTLPDTTSGIVRNEPAHTWESHYADAMRTMVEAHMAGVIPKHASGRRTETARPAMALTGSRRW